MGDLDMTTVTVWVRRKDRDWEPLEGIDGSPGLLGIPKDMGVYEIEVRFSEPQKVDEL